MSDFDAAFLFLEATAGPEDAYVVIDQPGARTALAWRPDPWAAARTAAELAAGGVRLIELYRGFDLNSAARVIEAVDGRAPVGLAMAAEPPGGRVRRSATIYADETAEPDADRVVREHPDGGITWVVAATDADIVGLATRLVDDGAELVEICGGTPLVSAARVAAAVGDRAAVTLVSWPFESIDGVAAYKATFDTAVGR